MKHAVIVGMGFGGLKAARALAGKGVEVLEVGLKVVAHVSRHSQVLDEVHHVAQRLERAGQGPFALGGRRQDQSVKIGASGGIPVKGVAGARPLLLG